MSVLDLPADDVVDLLADAAERNPRAGHVLDLALEELEHDLGAMTRLASLRFLQRVELTG